MECTHSNFSHALHTIRPIKGRTDDIEGSEVGKGDGDEEAEHEGTEKENDSWDAKNAALWEKSYVNN